MGDLDQTIAAIDRIVVGRTDDDMREVVDVYGRQSGRYAVYQTDDRVVIVYAEDPLVQAIQRKRLAKLATRRGELNGLLMAWRGKSIRWSRLPQTARQFDMRIAAALIEALEGNSASGIEILDQVRADVRGEMAARARLSYLIWTLSSAAVFLAAALIAYAMLAGGTSAAVLGTQAVLRAVCAGVLGGVFIRSRSASASAISRATCAATTISPIRWYASASARSRHSCSRVSCSAARCSWASAPTSS